MAHYELGDWAGAEAAFGRVLDLEPDRWAAWMYRGMARRERGAVEEAVGDFNRAVELAPKDARGWSARGDARARLDRGKEAAADFARAVELAASNVNSQRALALLRLAGDDGKGYRTTCADLLDRFGGATDPAVACAAARTCCLGPDAGVDAARVVHLAEGAVKADEKDANYRAALGVALFRKGDFDAAVQRLQEARQLAGADVPAATDLFLAMALQRVGKADDAARTLQQAARRQIREPDPAKGGAFLGRPHRASGVAAGGGGAYQGATAVSGWRVAEGLDRLGGPGAGDGRTAPRTRSRSVGVVQSPKFRRPRAVMGLHDQRRRRNRVRPLSAAHLPANLDRAVVGRTKVETRNTTICQDDRGASNAFGDVTWGGPGSRSALPPRPGWTANR